MGIFVSTYVYRLLIMIELSGLNRWLKDNYCRSRKTQLWVESEVFFPPSNWPPLHFLFIRLHLPLVESDYIRAAELSSVVAASLLSVFFYFFCRLRLSRILSLLCVVALSLCWPFLEFSTMGASEPLHLLLSFAAFYFIVKNNYWLSGVFLGLGALVRIEGWAILFLFLGFGFLLSFTKSISWKDYGKLASSSLALFCINYFYYEGNLLKPFEEHYQAQQVDKILRDFSGLNWEGLAKIFSGFGGYPYGIFVTLGVLGFLFWEKKKSWVWVCAMSVFVVTSLKLIGVGNNEVLPEARYFFLFFLGGLPFALFFWQRWVPGRLLGFVLVIFAAIMAVDSVSNILKPLDEKLDPFYNSAQRALLDELRPTDRLLIAVTNYNHCWFSIKSGLPIDQTQDLSNKRDRMIDKEDYRTPEDLEALFKGHGGDILLLEKNTLYDTLVKEHQQTQQTQMMRFQLQRKYRSDRFEIYRIHKNLPASEK